MWIKHGDTLHNTNRFIMISLRRNQVCGYSCAEDADNDAPWEIVECRDEAEAQYALKVIHEAIACGRNFLDMDECLAAYRGAVVAGEAA